MKDQYHVKTWLKPQERTSASAEARDLPMLFYV